MESHPYRNWLRERLLPNGSRQNLKHAEVTAHHFNLGLEFPADARRHPDGVNARDSVDAIPECYSSHGTAEPPNGSRLSCGALVTESSFNILRAPPASSAC
jgi:hypothetical protein